jgi:cytidylate kinase
MIIIINGQGRSGKDTVCKYIKEMVKNVTYISTIDKVRVAGALLGCHHKSIKDRQFLHELKMLASKYYNHSYEYVKNIIKHNTSDILLIHSREPEEISKFCKDFNAKSLLITRGEKKTFHNKADDSVFDYDYDYVLNNDETLEDLKIKVKEMINE